MALGNLINPHKHNFPIWKVGIICLLSDDGCNCYMKSLYMKDTLLGWIRNRCFKKCLLSSFNYFTWNGKDFTLEASTWAGAKHHTAWDIVLEGIGPSKHVLFAVGPGCFFLRGVIYITDFRLLFPKKIGFSFSFQTSIGHYIFGINLYLFDIHCILRIQKTGIGCKHQNSWDLHIFIMPQNTKLLGFYFLFAV